MKIRNGFVSNSSSSSFCIVGKNLGNRTDELIDKLEEQNINYECGIDNYYDEIIVGETIENMKDNQTLGEFKQQVFEKLKKAGLVESIDEIQIHIDGGYD